MANWNRWGVAAGLAGALALVGTARAQTPGTGSNTGTSQQGSPGTTVGEPTSAGTSTSSAHGSAGSSGSTKVDKKLEEDVQKIHAANQAEVHMGQMGEQQATSPEVKQFAQKLHEDHQRLDDKLTQTAQAAGISLEGKGFQDEQKSAEKAMQKLQGKTGHDFDKAFVSMMVKDHEKDIKETQKAAKEAKKQNQTELAALLDKAVTGMQGHLATAKQLEKSVAKGGKSASGSSSSSTGSGSSGSSGSTGGTTSTHDTGDTKPSSPSTTDTGNTSGTSKPKAPGQ